MPTNFNIGFKSIKTIIITLSLSLLSLHSQAQLKSKIALGGMYSKGNVNKQDFRFDADLTKTDSLLEFSGIAKAVYSRTNSALNNREYEGSLRADYLPYQVLSPFMAVTGYNNSFKDLNFRFSSMAGLKWSIFKTTEEKDKKKVISSYSISAALQYDIEQYYSDKAHNELFRLSIRPKIRQKLLENIFLDHLTFIKYKTNDFSDYQIDSHTGLSTQITKKLLLQISYDFDYSSKPPQPQDNSYTVLTTDQSFYISLVFKI